MRPLSSLVADMEELLAVCSRSIVAPDSIISEANRIMNIMSDHDLERKFFVEGCETLSVLASGFIRSGYEDFVIQYENKTGIDHSICGFADKEELVRYCEFCVTYGDQCLSNMKSEMMNQLEIENGMSKDEIRSLGIRNSVQDQMTDYIKLSLLVNSLKEFFKEYYKGMN
jgi:hypothetical protein